MFSVFFQSQNILLWTQGHKKDQNEYRPKQAPHPLHTPVCQKAESTSNGVNQMAWQASCNKKDGNKNDNAYNC